MKKTTTVGIISLSLAFAIGCEQKTHEEKGETVEAAIEANDTTHVRDQKKEDAEFIVKAANGGLLEVQAAKLAQEKALSKEVKEFAKTMESDHSKANTELQSYASKNNIVLPSSLDKDAEDKLKELREKKGTEFDKEYMDFMVDDHKEDVELFEEANESAGDPELKAWVGKTLPVLKHHLHMAQEKDSILDSKRN